MPDRKTCNGCYWFGNCQYTSPCAYYTPIDSCEIDMDFIIYMQKLRKE